MSPDDLRYVGAVFASAGVLLQVMALVRHWDGLAARARRVSISACFVLAPLAGGFWYAASNHFPQSPTTSILATGLLLFDLAVLYRLPSGR